MCSLTGVGVRLYVTFDLPDEILGGLESHLVAFVVVAANVDLTTKTSEFCFLWHPVWSPRVVVWVVAC